MTYRDAAIRWIKRKHVDEEVVLRAVDQRQAIVTSRIFDDHLFHVSVVIAEAVCRGVHAVCLDVSALCVLEQIRFPFDRSENWLEAV